MDRSLALSIRVMANNGAATLPTEHDVRPQRRPQRIFSALALCAFLAIQHLLAAPLSARYTTNPMTLHDLSIAETPIAKALVIPSESAAATGSIIVRAGSAPVVEGQTTVETSLALTGATDESNMGFLSVDVQYNAGVLRAIACTVHDNFDLLLCNMATPGVIQLAGVAASGIRSEVIVADLRFEILQPANPYSQLTVKLDDIGDVEGVALQATAQHGQIGTPCVPGSEGCAISAVVYLPLVHR